MRYRYFSAQSGKKVFGMLLLVCMAPVFLSSCAKSLLLRKNAVKPGVIFQGRDLAGLSPKEAYAVVSRLAESLAVVPVDAAFDPETGGVIPGLNGREVDVTATVQAILAARRGENVPPVFRETFPHVTLNDFPMLPIFRGNPAKPQVTFAVNVAWGNEHLPELLDALVETKAGATFFLVGRWVRQFPDLAEAIKNAGFELANHGDSDAVSPGTADVSLMREQIARCAETIEQICGVRPVYYSPHKGELTEKVLEAAAAEGSRVIMWTVDTVDWQLPGVEKMVEKILAKVAGGSVILMHPTEQTPGFLRQVVPLLRERGLEPVPLSVLLSPSLPAAGGVEVP